MEHERVLDEYTEMIEAALEPVLEEAAADAEEYHPLIGELYGFLSDFVMRRGKRLASASTLLTYRGYGGDVDDSRILAVARGVELYRHATLVHDDLIDGDDYRRGGETVHRHFGDEYGGRFGVGAAVFSGNVLTSLALEEILGSGFPPGDVIRVLRLIAGSERAVNESQVLDHAFEHRVPDREEWEAMASKRAASLFRFTLLSGAVLGGAPEEDVSLLRKASRHVGFSFDVQDDIIGAFASEDEYGRPVGGDLESWKKPLHVVHALEMAGDEEVRELESLAGEPVTGEDVERFRELVRDCGALERAKEESRGHADRAVELLEETSMDPEVKEFFSSFMEFVSESLEWYS